MQPPKPYFQKALNILQQMVLRQLEFHMQKNKVESLPYTIYKNQLKMGKRANISANTIKL